MKKLIGKIPSRYDKKTRATAISDEGVSWRQPVFWRNLFLYYWVFALAGHFMEVGWAWFTQSGFNAFTVPTISPLSGPYGIGVVALILFLRPLYRRFKRLNILLIFVLSVIITTAVEYLCAVVIVAFLGENPFWDYSHTRYNISGYVCLHNSLLFGLVSTLFIRFGFPLTERLFKKCSERLVNELFILLFTTYSLDLLLLLFTWLRQA
jgi:uncharacterized membrane protein